MLYKKYYKFLFKELKVKQVAHLVLTLTFIIFASLCTAYLPIILKKIVDQLSNHAEYLAVFNFITLYAIVLILERLFSEMQFISYPNWENKILKNAYKYSFESLFNNSPTYFKKNLYGTISSQIYRAISGLDSLMFDIIFKGFPLVVNFTFIIFSIILQLNITTALIITIGATIYTNIMYLFNNKLISYQTDLRDQANNAQGITTDLIASWKDVKLTNSHIFSNFIINQKTNSLLNKSKIFCYKRGIFGFVQSFFEL